MGICQSSALEVIVHDVENKKKKYYFSMKKMRTFHTVGDVLGLVGVELSPQDKVYVRSHVGLEEVPTHFQFQIRDLIIKDGRRVMKYRITMNSMY
jgi:hypothetical protein